MQLQLEDRLQLFRVQKVPNPDGRTYSTMIFAVPCKRIQNPYPDQYPERSEWVILLEEHPYIGEKGQRYCIEPNYRLSLEAAKRDVITRATRDSNRYLDALAVIRKDMLEVKAITRANTVTEGYAAFGRD